MIDVVNSILATYARQGYDLSLRQLYYQCVSRNLIRNKQTEYKRLGNLITDARMAGLVDWDMIADRGRPTMKVKQWSTAGRAVESLAEGFRFDRWKRQPCYVEVMVEKQALEGVLIPACNVYGVGFTANKGYSSSTALYEASKRILRAQKRGKSPVVLYLGDHDPSGIDMTRDLRDRLRVFCGREVDVKRLALNRSQVDENELPPNPAKLTDSRSGAYVAKHGNFSWELDALQPRVLAGLVTAAIKRRLDQKLWDEDTEREKELRTAIMVAAKTLDGSNGSETVIPDDDPNT